MIWIDNASGSAELQPYFSPYDVPTQLTELEYGDFCFMGNGPDGLVKVGIERKTFGFYKTLDGKGHIGTDFVSSKRSKRLSGHQIPGLFSSYEYVFFLLEGIWKVGEAGEIVIPQRGGWIPMYQGIKPLLYREFAGYIETLRLVCGGYVQETAGPMESAAWIVTLYKWFEKTWIEHTSHEDIYSIDPSLNRGRRMSFTPRRVGPVEQVAAQMPGVSRKAWEFGKKFHDVHEMVNASEAELMSVDGIGKKGAGNIYKWLRGIK